MAGSKTMVLPPRAFSLMMRTPPATVTRNKNLLQKDVVQRCCGLRRYEKLDVSCLGCLLPKRL